MPLFLGSHQLQLNGCCHTGDLEIFPKNRNAVSLWNTQLMAKVTATLVPGSCVGDGSRGRVTGKSVS